MRKEGKMEGMMGRRKEKGRKVGGMEEGRNEGRKERRMGEGGKEEWMNKGKGNARKKLYEERDIGMKYEKLEEVEFLRAKINHRYVSKQYYSTFLPLFSLSASSSPRSVFRVIVDS